MHVKHYTRNIITNTCTYSINKEVCRYLLQVVIPKVPIIRHTTLSFEKRRI